MSLRNEMSQVSNMKSSQRAAEKTFFSPQALTAILMKQYRQQQNEQEKEKAA